MFKRQETGDRRGRKTDDGKPKTEGGDARRVRRRQEWHETKGEVWPVIAALEMGKR